MKARRVRAREIDALPLHRQSTAWLCFITRWMERRRGHRLSRWARGAPEHWLYGSPLDERAPATHGVVWHQATCTRCGCAFRARLDHFGRAQSAGPLLAACPGRPFPLGHPWRRGS